MLESVDCLLICLAFQALERGKLKHTWSDLELKELITTVMHYIKIVDMGSPVRGSLKAKKKIQEHV